MTTNDNISSYQSFDDREYQSNQTASFPLNKQEPKDILNNNKCQKPETKDTFRA